jgi:hypothetical protein
MTKSVRDILIEARKLIECPCDRDKCIDPHCAAEGMCVREDNEDD